MVRGWQQDGGYSEPVTAVNPFAATLSSGVDSQYVARFGAQYTHLFFDRIEANVNAALAYGFDNRFGSQVYVIDFGPVAPYPLLNSAWAEFGGRLAYRFSQRLVADAFLLGTVGGEPGRTFTQASEFDTRSKINRAIFRRARSGDANPDPARSPPIG